MKLVVCSLWLAGLAQGAGPAEELVKLLKQFTEAYHAVEQNYADPVAPEQAFYTGAIPGLLRSLDPFSAFLDPDQFRSLKDMQQSVQKGSAVWCRWRRDAW
jgi:carboxyl-terminal processing protease